MSIKNGHFVISLDYELHWGLFDLKSVEEYNENLKNVALVIDRLLDLCDKYQVKLTFATVGFLFAKNKEELIRFSPKLKPEYTDDSLNPYNILESIGTNEINDPYHFGYSALDKIKNDGNHEISTHTYCHYYCNEDGQTLNEFKDDLDAVKQIGENFGTEIKSIVFPRNQVNDDYLKACSDTGILSYRGTETSKMYSISPKSKYYTSPIIRLQRILDSYINLTGQNTYDVVKINEGNHIINLPSSRFLRPFNKPLQLLDALKIRRIIKGMRHASKHNELFHLWWHPHNFGKDIDKNFKMLEHIFKEYKRLNSKNNFESITMTSLANKVRAILN